MHVVKLIIGETNIIQIYNYFHQNIKKLSINFLFYLNGCLQQKHVTFAEIHIRGSHKIIYKMKMTFENIGKDVYLIYI
jgi:hypothetical protein